ncbi:Autotransporter beta-domain protein [[Actinomadura] parvosata subsp. kistnae]|nr:Autotransporter beta-domain protein [Actinomadura parvosata subsp. kistnae]
MIMGSTRTNLTIVASVLLLAGQAVGAGPAAADGCPAATGQWEVTDLGVTGSALDINDLGQIAGSSVSASGEQRATVWDGAQVLDLGGLGGGHAYAGALDEHGNVVGSSYTAEEKGHAFHWRAGTMTDLGVFGSVPTRARDVSAGVIVGEYRHVLPNRTARYQAFRIENGVRTDLAAVSGSNAAAVNPAGQIAGTQGLLEPPGPASGRTHRAFLWDDGVITELGTLGGQWSQAEAINGDGDIVGQSALGADGVLAGGFIWSAGAGMRRLPDGGGVAAPKAVNDDDVIAGTLTCAATGTAAHAAVWTGPDAAPALLPDPATGTATMANAVNARGEITGWAEAPDGSRRALVWRPATNPE